MSEPTNGNGNGFSQRYAVIIQTVMVVALFGAAVWTGVLSPMVEAQRTIQRDLNADHAWTQKQDVQIKHVEEAIIRIDERHEKHVVPRSEEEIKNKQSDAQMALISERLNELRRDTYRTVTVGDELKRLQTEVSDLRKQLQDRQPNR